MKLAIAQFLSSLHLGGQERVTVDLARAFQKKGHQSIVCTTMVRGELADELESNGIQFKCFSFKKSYNLHSLTTVMRYLRENKVNVVITHGNYRFIPRIASIILQIPVIIHVEHNISNYKKFFHVLINKLLSMRTDKIICVSENAKKSLLEIERPNIDKVVVIPNGLDIERFSNLKPKQNIKKSVKRIGIIASFKEAKGHIYFVRAAAKIIQSFKNVEFIFVGDGSLRQMIEQKVREYGIEKYCHFLGNRSEVGEILETLDVFVLSSLWEGLPISILEAQYFGIASVVTNVGGNSEVIKDGYNGLLVPPKNSEALSAAIIKVLHDNKLRSFLGSNAREIFKHRYSIETMANAYLEQIYNILQYKKVKD